MSVCTGACVFECVYVRASLCVCVCMCLRVPVHVCVRACVRVYVDVDVVQIQCEGRRCYIIIVTIYCERK